MQRRHAWALGGIAAAALLLRTWRLGRYGLWTDEVYTYHVATRPLGEVLGEHDQTPPLFAALLHLWLRLVPDTDVAVRLPSVLFGVGAVVLLHQVARRFGPPRMALAAAAAAAMAVYFIIYSQEARAYALLLLLSVASFLCYLRLLERWSWGRAATYVAVGALLLYSHLYGAFYLAAQNLDLLTRRPRDWAHPRWLGPQAAIGLLFLPWLPVFLEAGQRVAEGFWIQPPDFWDVFWTLFVLAGSKLLAVAMLGLAGWLAWRRRKPRAQAAPGDQRHPLSILAWWLAVPVAVPFLVSFVFPMFTPRYGVPAGAALLILAFRAIEDMPARRRNVPVRALAAATLLTISAATAAVALTIPSESLDGRQDWPSVVALVEARSPPGSVVVFNKGYCDSGSDADLACAYERDAERADIRLVPFFFEDRGVSPPVDGSSVQRLDALVAGAPEVWVAYSYPSDLDGLIPARLEGLGYHAEGAWHLKRIDLLRFVQA